MRHVTKILYSQTVVTQDKCFRIHIIYKQLSKESIKRAGATITDFPQALHWVKLSKGLANEKPFEIGSKSFLSEGLPSKNSEFNILISIYLAYHL